VLLSLVVTPLLFAGLQALAGLAWREPDQAGPSWPLLRPSAWPVFRCGVTSALQLPLWRSGHAGSGPHALGCSIGLTGLLVINPAPSPNLHEPVALRHRVDELEQRLLQQVPRSVEQNARDL